MKSQKWAKITAGVVAKVLDYGMQGSRFKSNLYWANSQCLTKMFHTISKSRYTVKFVISKTAISRTSEIQPSASDEEPWDGEYEKKTRREKYRLPRFWMRQRVLSFYIRNLTAHLLTKFKYFVHNMFESDLPYHQIRSHRWAIKSCV